MCGSAGQVGPGLMGRAASVEPSASIESLMPLFDRGLVVILLADGAFYGLITRIDVLNRLRRKLG